MKSVRLPRVSRHICKPCTLLCKLRLQAIECDAAALEAVHVQRKRKRKEDLHLPDDYGVHDSDVGTHLILHLLCVCGSDPAASVRRA